MAEILVAVHEVCQRPQWRHAFKGMRFPWGLHNAQHYRRWLEASEMKVVTQPTMLLLWECHYSSSQLTHATHTYTHPALPLLVQAFAVPPSPLADTACWARWYCAPSGGSLGALAVEAWAEQWQTPGLG